MENWPQRSEVVRVTERVSGATRLRSATVAIALALFWTGLRHDIARADNDELVRVTFVDEGAQSRTIDGRIVTEAADGGILLLARDGRLWTIPPKRLTARERTKQRFTRLTPQQQAESLAAEFGSEFHIVTTPHYVIASSATPEYAKWCGQLFERLLDGFLSHWKEAGLELHEPTWPLPAVIFADENRFRAQASTDAGAFGEASKGYYSVRTNRIVLRDLAARKRGKRPFRPADFKPNSVAAFNVATIVHEATHQIAFNSGMHTRFADNPLWLTEGMAMNFEVPDLDGTTGWKTIGQVNRPRLDRFLEFSRRRRKRDSLATLISEPDRFADSRMAADAYAEAWALTFFLSAKHSTEYLAYIKRLAKKAPLVWDGPNGKLADFEAAFGGDLKSLDAEFLRFLRSQPHR